MAKTIVLFAELVESYAIEHDVTQQWKLLLL